MIVWFSPQQEAAPTKGHEMRHVFLWNHWLLKEKFTYYPDPRDCPEIWEFGIMERFEG